MLPVVFMPVGLVFVVLAQLGEAGERHCGRVWEQFVHNCIKRSLSLLNLLSGDDIVGASVILD